MASAAAIPASATIVNKHIPSSSSSFLNNKFNQQQKSSSDILISNNAVTADFDELRFHAAASRQVQHLLPSFLSSQAPQSPSLVTTDDSIDSNLLIASPYNDPLHLLQLQSVNPQSALLSIALTLFKPIRDDYATAPYHLSFNWDTIISALAHLSSSSSSIASQLGLTEPWRESTYYIVAFHSQLAPGVDKEFLGQLDKDAHAEATVHGGLLKYWFGDSGSHPDRRNLATCML